jgi:hypothetical protein
VSVAVRSARHGEGWVATVRVDQGGTRTEHRVTVLDEDLARYGVSDADDLVRRSFDFLLAREPNTSILREFRITEIERYFPEYAKEIRH